MINNKKLVADTFATFQTTVIFVHGGRLPCDEDGAPAEYPFISYQDSILLAEISLPLLGRKSSNSISVICLLFAPDCNHLRFIKRQIIAPVNSEFSFKMPPLRSDIASC